MPMGATALLWTFNSILKQRINIMLNTLIKRFLQLIFVLLSISTIVFFLQHMIPGNPADIVLGIDASDADKSKWLERYGLNRPILIQYFDFFGQLLRGQLGYTYQGHQRVSDILWPRLWETAKLALCAFSFSITVATFFGVISALRAGRAVDKTTAIVSLLAISAPSFIIAPLLMWLFAVKWNVLPLMGNSEAASYVLPTITLGLSLAAFSSRMIRSGVVDVLQEDYIRTARSKGLPPSAVIFKHALRNAFLPTLTVLGLQLGVLLSGTVITEQIFNWPGLGSLVVEAVQQREYNIVSGCVLTMATIYVLSSLIVDILYCVFDPRVRLT